MPYILTCLEQANRFMCFAASIMRSSDISRDEKEDLPRILDPLAKESAEAFVTGTNASQGNLLENKSLVHILEDSCKALQRLQVIFK